MVAILIILINILYAINLCLSLEIKYHTSFSSLSEDSLTPMLAAAAKIAETEETIFVEDNEHQLSPNK